MICPLCEKKDALLIKEFQTSEDCHGFVCACDAVCLNCKLSFRFKTYDIVTYEKIYELMKRKIEEVNPERKNEN